MKEAKREDLKNWCYSEGYDATCGFYIKLKDFKKIREDKRYNGEIWISFPNKIREELSKNTMMSVNWRLRLRYLFNPNFN